MCNRMKTRNISCFGNFKNLIRTSKSFLVPFLDTESKGNLKKTCLHESSYQI